MGHSGRLVLGQVGESVKLQRPHLLQRLAERTERLQVGSVKVPLAVAPDADEAGLTEDAQVLRDGTEADVEALGDVARGELLLRGRRLQCALK